jgi:coenzyme F420-reducing hydrogenase gamma subunit
MTGKDVEPTVMGCPPSEFEIVAVIVAVPTESPSTTTAVVFVKVPVGLTMAAGLVIEREIGSAFDAGETAAVVVPVCPTKTEEMGEKHTVGFGTTVLGPLP